MKPIVVVGSARGQLASAIVARLESEKISHVLWDRARMDLSRAQESAALRETLRAFDACAVVNAAAFTDVAKAEIEKSLANVINGEAPGVLARVCAEKKIPFITFSTDYVFDGTKRSPYVETDEVHPLNEYGRSKALGEKLVLEAGGFAYIFRTSWIYSVSGTNFVNTMLKLAREKEELQVVSDQIGAPTFAVDLAAAVTTIVARILRSPVSCPTGLYHLTNAGQTSWFDFAELIFGRAREKGVPLKVRSVKSVLSKDYKSPVARPLNSVLSNQKVKNTFQISLRSYKEAVAECLERMK